MRIIGIDVPGFGVPTHAEAKDVLAGAMLRYARTEAEQGPVQAPRAGRSEKPTVSLVGEMFPVDPVTIGMMLEPLGLAAGPGDNRLEAGLTTSMYLGDKWEHLFALGESRLRAYGDKPLASGRHWLEVPRESLWVF